jgi:hypothetical protein
VERLGGPTNPFEPITDAAVANPWWVVSGLAMLAATAASAAVFLGGGTRPATGTAASLQSSTCVRIDQ